MNIFKDKTFADRRGAAAAARQAALDKFRSRPGSDDPAVIERNAKRLEISVARETRAAERIATKAAEEARLETERVTREATERVERAARQEREGVEQAAIETERKAARDARYAARKSRKG